MLEHLGDRSPTVRVERGDRLPGLEELRDRCPRDHGPLPEKGGHVVLAGIADEPGLVVVRDFHRLGRESFEGQHPVDGDAVVADRHRVDTARSGHRTRDGAGTDNLRVGEPLLPHTYPRRSGADLARTMPKKAPRNRSSELELPARTPREALGFYGYRVRDVMTRPVASIPPGASLSEAATRMSRRGISGLPVLTDGGRLVGVLSQKDILRILAARAGLRLPGSVLDLVLARS